MIFQNILVLEALVVQWYKRVTITSWLKSIIILIFCVLTTRQKRGVELRHSRHIASKIGKWETECPNTKRPLPTFLWTTREAEENNNILLWLANNLYLLLLSLSRCRKKRPFCFITAKHKTSKLIQVFYHGTSALLFWY